MTSIAQWTWSTPVVASCHTPTGTRRPHPQKCYQIGPKPASHRLARFEFREVVLNAPSSVPLEAAGRRRGPFASAATPRRREVPTAAEELEADSPMPAPGSGAQMPDG
eukprot:9776361-Heterocapsa_arctica.AAC.1